MCGCFDPGWRASGSPLVEGVDGVACGLRIAAQLVSDLVGIFAPATGEKYLATAQGEGIRRTQARLQRLTLGVAQGRTKIGRFMLWRITLNYRPVW